MATVTIKSAADSVEKLKKRRICRFFRCNLGLKNKLCKCNFPRINDNTKNAAKSGNAEERPDAGCEIKRWKAAAEMSSFFIVPPDISKADKPREFEGSALNSHQAANLSSKKIANCEYASPQSLTGIVHFFETSLTLR